MTKPLIPALALATVSLLPFAGTIHAASVANDNAANYTTTTWVTGSNLGTGFGAWTLTPNATANTNATAGSFIGNSTQLSNTNQGGNINSSAGTSFGMYGQNSTSGTAGTGGFDAFRSFTGALSIGQTFSLNLAANFRNGNKGFDLRVGGTTIFNFNIGGDDYVVNNATTGNGTIGNTYSTNTAFNLSFTQTTATGGTWTITRSGGVTDRDTGTYTGVPDTLHLYVNGTGPNVENNLYANSLAITNAVPEPGTWATLLMGGAGLVGFAARRRSARA